MTAATGRSCLQRALGLVVCAIWIATAAPLRAQTAVTLSPAVAPSAGQAGVTSVNVTGSNFPAGTILPAAVTVTLDPVTPGAGPSASTAATAVATVTGTTRRVTFQLPATVTVAAPAAYLLRVSGVTSTGVPFASANTVTMTVNPPAAIASLAPSAVSPGATVDVTITTVFTNFVQGSTQASFGPGTSVNGGADAAFAAITVTSAATATARVTASVSAAGGPRTVVVRTGVQQASLAGTFTVNAAAPSSPPVITISLSPQPNANGWHNTPVTAHVTCTQDGMPLAGCPADRIITAEGANQTVTGSVTSAAGQTASVTSDPFSIDLTPPVVTVALSPVPNASGIFTAPVTAHFTCADAGSSVAFCPLDQIFSVAGTNLVASGTGTDLAGNSTPVTSPPFTIQLGGGVPIIEVSLSPAPNANGWHNTPVTAHFTCTQEGMPLAGCPADRIISTEGANQTVSGSVTNAAGQTASVTSGPFSIDATPPVLAFSTPPPATAAPESQISITVVANDNLSLVSVTLSVDGVMVDTRTAGPFAFPVAIPADVPAGGISQISVEGRDLAGNVATLTHTLSIDVVSPLSLSVTPPQSPTFDASQIVKGIVEGATGPATIGITGGAATVNGAVPSGQTAFGLRVPLRPNTENSLRVTATDGSGRQVSAYNLRVVQLSLSSLVSAQVTAQRLTTPEVQALVANGTIDIGDPANFNVSMFSIALTVAGRAATVTVPLVKELGESFALGPIITVKCGPPDSDITETANEIVVPCGDDELPPDRNEPIRLVPFELDIGGGGGGAPRISGVILVNGRIKTLKEFFKVDLLLMNVSEQFTLTNLTARLDLPGGGVSPVTPAGGALALDDLAPHAQATGQFVIRGDRIGRHPVAVSFGGLLTGPILTEPVPIAGSASTEVEVKGPPALDVTVHLPDAVTADEEFQITVDIMNTSSDLDALYASLEIDVGGNIELIDPTTGEPASGPSIASLGDILAGRSVSRSFTVVPRISGPVVACVAVATANISLSVTFPTADLPCPVGKIPAQTAPESGLPTVTILPAPNATDVPLETAIVAFFSTSVQTSTITIGQHGGTFGLFDSGGEPVPGHLAFSSLTSGATVATFVPDAALLPRSTYTVVVGAGIYDTTGRQLASGVTARFTTAAEPRLDTTPPQITLNVQSPANPLAVPHGQLVRILADWTDNSASVRIDLSVDGRLVDARLVAGPVVFLLGTSDLDAGSPHVVSAVVTDAAGNTGSTSLNLGIVPDSVAPDVSVTGPSSAVRGEPLVVSVQASDDNQIARVDAFLDAGGAAVYSSLVAPFRFSLNTSFLGDGPHRLRVQATDGAGNVAHAVLDFSLRSLVGLSLLPSTLTLTGRGVTQALAVTATYSDGTVVPAPARTQFFSSASGVAAVSPAGVVTSGGVGNAVITAVAGSFVRQAFVSVVAAPPAALLPAGGDNQTGTIGMGLPVPLSVRVSDANGLPVSDASVAFSVTEGGGSVAASTVLTNAQGLASTTLTLGPGAGANLVVATVNGLPGTQAIFHATGRAPNRAPTWTDPGSQSTVESADVTLQLAATDADGDALTFTATGLPPGLSMDTATGTIVGTTTATAGDYHVQVTISDGYTATVQTLVWTVVPPPTPFVDLSVTMIVSPNTVPIGAALTYSATVRNLGTASATGVVLRATLPSGTMLIDAPPGCTNAAGALSCDIGTLGPSQLAAVTLRAVAYVTGVVTSEATVSSPEKDWAPSNNAATAAAVVLLAPLGVPGQLPNAISELFDPSTGTWAQTGGLAAARAGTTPTVIGDGSVVVPGGVTDVSNPASVLSTVEAFNPATGSWTGAIPLDAARAFHTATLLPNGDVLVTGGLDANGNPLASATLYRGPPIQRTTPLITWPTPAAIPYGTRLGDTQLNATANVPGTFVYVPAAGTLLAAGTHTLTVTFVPADTVRFQSVRATTVLTVTP